MNLPNGSQFNAAARNVGSYAAGMATAFGLAKGYVTTDQIKAAANAVGDLGQALIAFVAAITPFVTAFYAWRSSSKSAQIAAVAANPDVQRIVVSSQEVADAAPPKVVTPLDVAQGAAPPIVPARP